MSIRDEVLTGSAGVDGLRTLLYGRAHRRRLHRLIDDLLEPQNRIARCELERAKFKPGRKLTGYFVVHVVGVQPCTRAIEVVWALDPGTNAEDAGEAAMQEEAVSAGVAAPFHDLRNRATSRPGVRVAPLDVSYPQLVRLCQPEHVRDLVDAVT